MNVVAQWRNRARDLRGEMWHCGKCGRLAGVRRVACAWCGQVMSAPDRTAMPRTFKGLEVSHAHTVVETMDQVSGLATVMLAEARNGQLFALPLCESDALHGAELVGETLELTLRRTGDSVGPGDPISYGRKLAASASTRLRLKRDSKKEGDSR